MATAFLRMALIDAPHHIFGEGKEPPDERIPCVRVIPDPVKHIQGDGLHQLEEQVIVGHFVHAGRVRDLTRVSPRICGGNMQKREQ